MATIIDQRRARFAMALMAVLGMMIMPASAGSAAAASQCGPSLLGAPCAVDGVATQAESGASSSLAIGNPVNLATGNKYQREADMPAAPGPLGIELIRHYNARDLRTEALGRNWVWSYDTRLFRVGDTVQIVQADGSRVDFSRTPGASTCLPADPALGVLHVQAGVRGETMSWQWRDGRVLNFDENGFLVGISIASGQTVSIRRARELGRHRGALLGVTDPQGRQLAFQYGAAEADGWRPLLRVDTPGGRFTYAQDAERRLSTAARPDGDARDYLYESGSAAWLTGIVARPVGQAPRRIRSWAYDARGRVVTAVHGTLNARAGRQQIDYADGRTTVRDAAGGVTRLLHRQAGARTVLTAVEGAGCEGCAPVDNSRRYDALGRLMQADGIAVTRDILGRVTRLRDAAGVTQVAWLGDSSLPTQVDTPSRVGGQRHTRHIDWLSFTDPATGVWRAVPRRIAEAGWRPGEQGPQAIARAWLLDWKIERGVAMLAGVVPEVAAAKTVAEPALAAFPSSASQSSASIPPGLPRAVQSPDASLAPGAVSGRSASRTGAAASSTQGARAADATRVAQPSKPASRDASLPPISGWPDLRWRRDDFGLPVRAEDVGGKPVAGAEARDYDPAGRLIARQFADGTRWAYIYDAQGRLQAHRATRAGDTVDTRLSWSEGLPVRIDHPVESERRGYGADGRMAWRDVSRSVGRAGGGSEPVRAAEGRSAAGRAVDAHSDVRSDDVRSVDMHAADLRYAEAFDWDTQGRLARHDLPEGGSLYYTWSEQGLTAIRYASPDGPVVPVFQQLAGPGGVTRRWFNGVTGVSQAGRSLHYRGRDGVLLGLVRQVDGQGKVVAEAVYRPDTDARDSHQPAASTGVFASHRYAYDNAGRLIAASHAGGQGAVPALWSPRPADFYAWRDGGEAVAIAAQGMSVKPVRSRELGGLPVRADGYTLRYGPARRLAAVDRNGVAVARYVHNAFGERVIREVAGKGPSHDFYLGQQLVAEQGDGPAGTITRRYVYAGHEAVAILDYAGGRPIGTRRVDTASVDDSIPMASPRRTLDPAKEAPSDVIAGLRWVTSFFSPSPQASPPVLILAVHPDSIGTPRLVTDADQIERWRGDFSPFGALRSEAGDISMRLRLPGQVIDPETGWHDNYLRTYDPQSGAYLEPDPLGAEPGTEAYGYAAQQPTQFIDPLGLLLFAFDGTRNSPASRTNIFLMSQWYRDADMTGDASGVLFGSKAMHYVSGPGSQPEMLTGAADTATASTVESRIATQWDRLIQEVSVRGADKAPMQIDIIGFSRGAAAARDFANRIADLMVNGRISLRNAAGAVVSACVNLRFLGLFDTVTQIGIDGKEDGDFNFTIAPGWDQVAHIVATSERRYLFPSTLTQTQGGNAAGVAGSIKEIALIGAHSDIGGGYTYEKDGEIRGDLSDVALNWMLNQAHGAGLAFSNVPTAHRSVTDPLVHQEMNPRPFFQGVDGDRRMFFADGGMAYTRQDYHPGFGKNLRDDFEAFIVRDTPWSTPTGPAVGYVRMDEYQQWLAQIVGVQMLP